MIGRRLRKDRRAVTALELAVLGPLLIFATFAVLGTGLTIWSLSAMQTAATDAARCGAIGSPSCATTTQAKSYAQAQAASWSFSAMVAVTSIEIVSGATRCNGATGKFYLVIISSNYFGSGILPIPWNHGGMVVTGCYPMA